jgi:peptidoglycan hydrolase-like protein with peptidoglycan-binding domain
MTPRQAQIALVGFILVAAGVAYNALYMQGETGAARRTAGKDVPAADPGRKSELPPPAKSQRGAEVSKRTAQLKPDSAKVDATPEALPDEASTETIKGIQRELARLGYGQIGSDGIIRPVTRAAIMAYEYDHRLPLTGEATEALLSRLVLGPPAAADASGSREVRSPHAETMIRLVQRALVAAGYRPGAIDGRLSADTLSAIRVFEEDQGLAPRGRISAEVVSRLHEATAVRSKSAEMR